MVTVDVQLTDNSEQVLEALAAALERGLEAIGLSAESHAKELCVVDTGRLRNSITHVVQDNEVYIGTNVEYAPYIELGTGIYAEEGNGRTTPWSYQDEKGNWVTTRGSKPHPFLRPAASNYGSEYKTLLESALKNG